MKKILFYAGLLALATSCAENELDSLTTQKQAKGIVFEAANADTKMQWDETETSFVPFWYAEQDRIGLFGLSVVKGEDNPATLDVNESLLVGDGFEDLGSTPKVADAVYKATQSKKNGVFTATNDDNMLDFDGDKVARFVAVYPSTVKANYNDGKIVLSNLPDLKAQTQETANGFNKAVVMYDLTSAKKENGYDAVGEKVSLSFQRPLSAIVFRTANADEYTVAQDGGTSIFGYLQTIEIETKGYDANGDNTITLNSADIAATTIAYDNSLSTSTATIEVDTLTKAAKYVPGATENGSSNVILTLNQPWKDGNLAIAAVKNVDRTAFRQKGVSEAISVKFKFANIDLESKTKTVSVDFNGFLKFPELDINEYDYLVTKGAANTRTLIVNKGYFSNIFDANGKVIWNDTQTTEAGTENVGVTEFNEVIVNEDVVLNDAEFAKLNTFTNVKKLTLKGNTEIKEGALSALTLEYINMPKVTKFGANPFNAASTLSTVLLPSYNFEDLSINPSILKQASLVVLDMSGVEVMNAGFPAKGLSLADYTALETVTVKDGVKVGANAFKGCTALTTVNGEVDIEGTAAFKGCTSLTTINILNNTIEANVFEGDIALENVLYNGEQVVPEAVGVEAFKGCVALKNMNLKNAGTIGAGAFMDCVALIGTEKAENDKNVLYVGAKNISKNAFAGCIALEYVYFTDATGFEDNILGATTQNAETTSPAMNYQLKEVKFGTPFKQASVKTASATTFGSETKVRDVKLFVHPDQDPDMLEDATLILKTTPGVKVTFASIIKEAKY